MKIVTDKHTGQKWLEIGRFRIFPIYNEWQELKKLSRQNWVNFHFIKIEVEHANYCQRIEVQLALLGFLWIIEYYWGELTHAAD